jgi:hypothetical protein
MSQQQLPITPVEQSHVQDQPAYRLFFAQHVKTDIVFGDVLENAIVNHLRQGCLYFQPAAGFIDGMYYRQFTETTVRMRCEKPQQTQATAVAYKFLHQLAYVRLAFIFRNLNGGHTGLLSRFLA